MSESLEQFHFPGLMSELSPEVREDLIFFSQLGPTAKFIPGVGESASQIDFGDLISFDLEDQQQKLKKAAKGPRREREVKKHNKKPRGKGRRRKEKEPSPPSTADSGSGASVGATQSRSFPDMTLSCREQDCKREDFSRVLDAVSQNFELLCYSMYVWMYGLPVDINIYEYCSVWAYQLHVFSLAHVKILASIRCHFQSKI